ncbi:MAG TPA: NAD(P)/FAD-dependent oxidoreductase [Candidatus Elarobacter sp.]
MNAAVDTEVCIVGAGFGGLGIAITLKRARFDDFVVLERGNAVGGTWRDNVYPGCACDIPTTLYSYSFEPNPHWTRLYPRREELWDYLADCARRYGLEPHLRFGRALDDAVWDDTTATWHVRTADGATLRCRVLILATGALNRPKRPPIPGRDTFAGTAFHSSEWDASVDLRGKQVAVIGTGASAVQIVPEIAAEVARLTIFQRTPPWIFPRFDRPIGARERALRRFIPGYARLTRALLYWSLEVRAYGFTVKPDLLQRREALALRYLSRKVADPALRRALTPHYRMGCKRVLLSDDYYDAVQRPNVTLTTEATAIEPDGVRTADGTLHPADVIVYATGFEATKQLSGVRITGRDGMALADAWRDGMAAYLGTSVAGFPNLFMIVGPNTGLGHNSMVVMMEAQYAYVVDALRRMRRTKVRALDVRPDVQRTFNDELQRKMRGTVWASGCSSWYQDERGKNTTLWPGFTFAFRRLTRRFRPDRYHAV